MSVDKQVLFQEMKQRVTTKTSTLTNSNLKEAIKVKLQICSDTIKTLELPIIPTYLGNTTVEKEIEKTEEMIYSMINNFN